jgi:hypothetical protein
VPPQGQLAGGLPNRVHSKSLWRRARAREVRSSEELLADDRDVCGQVGYVVAPPSRTEHTYMWLDRSPPPSASWLLGRLKAVTSGETLI